jgi:hypothetical protein
MWIEGEEAAPLIEKGPRPEASKGRVRGLCHAEKGQARAQPERAAMPWTPEGPQHAELAAVLGTNRDKPRKLSSILDYLANPFYFFIVLGSSHGCIEVREDHHTLHHLVRPRSLGAVRREPVPLNKQI